MKLIIDIDENLYTRLFDNGVDNYDDAIDMAKSIRKGIPLKNIKAEITDNDKVMMQETLFSYQAVIPVDEVIEILDRHIKEI